MFLMKILKIFLVLLTALFLGGCGKGPGYPGQLSANGSKGPPPSPSRYRSELAIVRNGKFKKQNILNRKERDLFWKLVNYCRDKQLMVFAQVSLGELLSSDGKEYWAINSKRVDFCITGKNFDPIAVIEFQGPGHINATSEERDEIKRAAVEGAGIYFIAINDGDENSVSEILNSYFVETS
jgi:hypothetical protein